MAFVIHHTIQISFDVSFLGPNGRWVKRRRRRRGEQWIMGEILSLLKSGIKRMFHLHALGWERERVRVQCSSMLSRHHHHHPPLRASERRGPSLARMIKCNSCFSLSFYSIGICCWSKKIFWKKKLYETTSRLLFGFFFFFFLLNAYWVLVDVGFYICLAAMDDKWWSTWINGPRRKEMKGLRRKE